MERAARRVARVSEVGSPARCDGGEMSLTVVKKLPHELESNAFRLGQLRSLCADCHNRLDANNAPRSPVREDGTPSDPNHPWNTGS
jgi:hypothetical protein